MMSLEHLDENPTWGQASQNEKDEFKKHMAGRDHKKGKTFVNTAWEWFHKGWRAEKIANKKTKYDVRGQ